MNAPRPNAPPLRFQRAELREKAGLSAAGIACLATAAGPQQLVAALAEQTGDQDAVNALAQILPHRQAVWWACLATRLIADLPLRAGDLAAVERAEAWVQTSDPAEAARAGAATEQCDPQTAAYWTAMAAFWSGPSLAPAELTAVPPAPHLPGVAVRTALMMLLNEPGLAGVGYRDLLQIGTELMHGDLGRAAQAAIRNRIVGES